MGTICGSRGAMNMYYEGCGRVEEKDTSGRSHVREIKANTGETTINLQFKKDTPAHVGSSLATCLHENVPIGRAVCLCLFFLPY